MYLGGQPASESPAPPPMGARCSGVRCGCGITYLAGLQHGFFSLQALLCACKRLALRLSVLCQCNSADARASSRSRSPAMFPALPQRQHLSTDVSTCHPAAQTRNFWHLAVQGPSTAQHGYVCRRPSSLVGMSLKHAHFLDSLWRARRCCHMVCELPQVGDETTAAALQLPPCTPDTEDRRCWPPRTCGSSCARATTPPSAPLGLFQRRAPLSRAVPPFTVGAEYSKVESSPGLHALQQLHAAPLAAAGSVTFPAARALGAAAALAGWEGGGASGGVLGVGW